MTSASFQRFMTVSASTKRPPVMSAGKRGAPAIHLAELSITPLDPTDGVTREEVFRRRPELQGAIRLLATCTDASDVWEGDVLTVDGIDYPIRLVNRWTWRGSVYLHVIIEELQR